MDKKGIRQWNVTNYLEAFPKEYYLEKIEKKQLFVMKENGIVAACLALSEQDSCWDDTDNTSVLYLHHLATAQWAKGIGREMLSAAEKQAKKQGKTCLRLDCAVDNEFLNSYYEAAAYVLVGRCTVGNYIGNKREKQL